MLFVNRNSVRLLATRVKTLKERMLELVPEKREQVKRVKQVLGQQSLGTVTVDMAYGGMRGIKGLIYETSLLDPEEGIRFRGLTIPECRAKLPRIGEEPLPEAVFWLLMTGEVPTMAETIQLGKEWRQREQEHPLPPALNEMISKHYARTLHPMSQLSMGLTAMQNQSLLVEKYHAGVTKAQLWEAAYEDVSNIIALLPRIASLIYTSRYGKQAKHDGNVSDWAGRFALSLGFDDSKFMELMRLYLSIHTDHEGGNVSAHTVKLVGSALSDPYLSYAAGLNGLAGPLHGLANQEVLQWLTKMRAALGDSPSDSQVEKYVWDWLGSGQVIPGYGHAVLRKTDPRYTSQQEFAMKHCPNDPLIRMTAQLYKIVPRVLTEHGKTKNPWPNVDAHSGVLLQHYGLVEQDFYTVLFGVSRALGALSSLVWDRALLMSIERPKSMTTDSIISMFPEQWQAAQKMN